VSAERCATALLDAAAHFRRLARDGAFTAAVAEAADLTADALASGGRVIACGNGGSMSDAAHFAEELTGRFREDRAPLAAMAVTDPGHLTCVANDYGFEHVFSRYVTAHGRAGDVLVALSTSGRSPNVLAAARAAIAADMRVVALTGAPASPLAGLATVEICAAAPRRADAAQQAHIVALHTMVDLIERRVFGDADAHAWTPALRQKSSASASVTSSGVAGSQPSARRRSARP
jgi:D-sedoheptulose 7-phosphate isomerase